jgi:hypothetical protein
MISAIEVSYYPIGAQVMTLVLPLGLFIVVMIVMFFLLSRPHTVPGRRPIAGARPVAPHPDAAAGIATAAGLPLATGTGTPEPLADRGAAPTGGVIPSDTASEGTAAHEDAPGEAGPEAGPTGSPEDPE